MNAYKYPQDLAGALPETWYETYRELEPPPLPEHEYLTRLLEIAYHASFTTEERRGTCFSAVICAPEASEKPIVFASPRDFNLHELMRLAPVAAGDGVMVGITHSNDTAVPQIWGLCSDAVSQLVIRVPGPGALDITRNDVTILSLKTGRIAQSSGGSGHEMVTHFLEHANRALWSGIEFGGATWSPEHVVYPSYLFDIAGAISREGHGGALLVVPEASADSVYPLVKIKYACNDDAIWPTLLVAIRRYHDPTFQNDREVSRVETAEAETQRLLRRLANLAAVDGAVLITDRFRLLGFGVEVVAPAAVSHVEIWPEGPAPVEAFGTRHRSAIRFCSAFPQGMALVCSQDGGIRCIQSRDGKVILTDW